MPGQTAVVPGGGETPRDTKPGGTRGVSNVPGQVPQKEKQASQGKKQLSEVEGANGVVWKIVKKLGSGSFGDVYLGCQSKKLGEPTEVAIKVEDLKATHPQLAYEAKLLSLLKGTKGIAQLYWSGVCRGFQVMVTELLSYSLEDVLVLCYGKLTLKTVLLMTEQLLTRIEEVHNMGFIHRDIKPENFLLGRGEKTDTVHAIDFGLSKRYCDAKTYEHIPYKDNKSLTGTARYASVNAHRGIEQSRRDDLEAIGHMFFYFLKGTLPWQGLPAKTKEEKYRKIKEKKIETSVEQLAIGLPEEFATYLQYVRSLRFQDRPDYAYLRGLFQELYVAEGYDKQDPVFDWSSKIKDKAASAIKAVQDQTAPTAGGPPTNVTNITNADPTLQSRLDKTRSGVKAKGGFSLFGICGKTNGAVDNQEV